MEDDEEKIRLLKEWRKTLEDKLAIFKEEQRIVSNERFEIQKKFDKRMAKFNLIMRNKDKYIKTIFDTMETIKKELTKIESKKETKGQEV